VAGALPHGAGYATRRDVVVHFARNNRSALYSDREWHCRRQYADLFAVRGLVAVLRDHRTVGPMNASVVSGLVKRRADASPSGPLRSPQLKACRKSWEGPTSKMVINVVLSMRQAVRCWPREPTFG
jgi:hypothetical protein